uniref:Uncharacterized protein n=1 Tax=Brassica campestris TaxID=3711 RepID=M4F044_BRACM
MVNSNVLFSGLKSGRCSSVVEARLVRFWEARNVKRGGELMWMDLLMVDVNALLSGDLQSNISPTSSEPYAKTTVRSTKAATSSRSRPHGAAFIALRLLSYMPCHEMNLTCIKSYIAFPIFSSFSAI